MSEWGQCVTHHICDCKQEELERLREQNTDLLAVNDKALSGWNADLNRLEAEVERLQRLVEDHKRERKGMGKANAEMAGG